MISDFDVILKISLIKDHQYPRLIERSRRVSGLMIEMKPFIDKKNVDDSGYKYIIYTLNHLNSSHLLAVHEEDGDR